LDPWKMYNRREVEYQVKKSRIRTKQKLGRYKNTSATTAISQLLENY